jgi:hypothetical protein
MPEADIEPLSSLSGDSSLDYVISDSRIERIQEPRVFGFPVECDLFTCYDFSVLDSDRHVAG